MIKYLLFFVVLLIPNISHAALLESNEGTSVDTENFGSTHYKGQSFIHSGSDFDITSIEIWGGLGNSPDLGLRPVSYSTLWSFRPPLLLPLLSLCH